MKVGRGFPILVRIVFPRIVFFFGVVRFIGGVASWKVAISSSSFCFAFAFAFSFAFGLAFAPTFAFRFSFSFAFAFALGLVCRVPITPIC